jgi:hypothetical protein
LRTKVSTKRRSLEIYLTQCGTKKWLYRFPKQENTV